MSEPITIAAVAVLALLAICGIFPRLGSRVSRWARGFFYLSVLAGILAWTLIKSCFVLIGRRLSIG